MREQYFMLDSYLSLGDPQIEIRFVAGDEEYAHLAFDALHKALPTLFGYFQVSTSFPKITVVLVPNRQEFDRLVCDLLRVEIEMPSHPARIAQPQRTDMVVISPPAYPAHTVYTYILEDFQRLLVHELVHMLEEFLSPDIENTPRWWSEGLAVYLSGQASCEDQFRKAALEGIARKAFPTFQQIEAERGLAYDWGWTIVRFLESTYGPQLIARIVRECTGDNLLSLTGQDISKLESRWLDWMLAFSSNTGASF